MCAAVKTLLALPILGLVSIPLVFSAWVTISLALITLFIRLAVVYIELGYVLLTNVFALPTSSSSLLTFAPSEPPTPRTGLSRRNSNSYGLVHSHQGNDSASPWTVNTLQDDLATRNHRLYARSMAAAHHLPATPFTGLPISGDERRDFEGVGGWSSYLDSSKPRGSHAGHEDPFSYTSSSSTTSVAGGVDIDADERAWLSLNHRLELPSQVITLESPAPYRLNTPSMSRSEGYVHAHGPATSSRLYQAQQHPGLRHHQRSHTTSCLLTLNRGVGGGLSLALSTRPHHTSTHLLSPSASRLAHFMTRQSYLNSPTLPHMRTPAVSSAFSSFEVGLAPRTLWSSSGGTGDGGGGYFAIQRSGSHNGPSLSGTPAACGYTSPGNGTLSERRDNSSSQLTRLVARYPPSVRHRRRSVSGTVSGDRL